MLPIDVPAVLDALPEEDRMETIERYSFTFGLLCCLFSRNSPGAMRDFQGAHSARACTPAETRLTPSHAPN